MEKEGDFADDNKSNGKIRESVENSAATEPEGNKQHATTGLPEHFPITDNPFAGMSIGSHDVLHDQVGRSKCPSCHASRKWYCYTCFRILDELKDKIPQVELPIKVDIIKHPRELEGKSTAVHAAVMAPSSVNVHIYPCIPDLDKDKVVLVFPSSSSVPLQDLAKQSSNSERSSDENGSVARKQNDDEDEQPVAKKQKCNPKFVAPFNRVVFIDSTWNQTAGIFKDERFRDIQCVILKSAKTTFWRRQIGKPNNYLATVEAVYYFMLEYHELFIDSEYDGRYDNLLYFYSYLHKIVQDSIKKQKREGSFKPKPPSRKKQREVTV